ncbi:MAG: DoxX family protein [Bradyrhizobiaceae bacterium]|nr:DoxX family protein [Bradyrhizobiaceae bacterium]
MALTGFYRVQAFLGLIYLCLGSAKLLGADIMVEAFDATGLGQSLRVAVGVLEIGGGLCLFVPRASIYAAVVLGCTIVGILGAAVGHIARLDDEQPFAAPRLTITKTWRASAHDGVAAAVWFAPIDIAHRWTRVEG